MFDGIRMASDHLNEPVPAARSSYRTLLDQGYMARRRGDHAAALGYFQNAGAARPDKRRPRLEAAVELRKISHLAEAEALYRSILDDQPKQVRALTGLGRIARARGDHRLAIQHYRAALALRPNRTDLKLRIAAELTHLSRIEEARRIYDCIVLEQPNHAVARVQLRKLPKPRRSGLAPFEQSWLARDTFKLSDTWGRNLETLGMPAFGVGLLTLAQDFACGATEIVKPDCILIRRNDTAKILPLVDDWHDFERILDREVAALPSGSLLGYVPESRSDGSGRNFNVRDSNREFVYHRASAAGMMGPSLSKYRQEVRWLLRQGARVEPIDATNLDRVLACNDRWYAGKHQRRRKTYYLRRTLWTLENLAALEPLRLRHLAVVLEDDVVGYAVSSHIGSSWAVFIYRRCDRDPPGIAPYLLSEMCKLYPGCEWINDGPAVRKPGLAWFKERFTVNALDRQLSFGWIEA